MARVNAYASVSDSSPADVAIVWGLRSGAPVLRLCLRNGSSTASISTTKAGSRRSFSLGDWGRGTSYRGGGGSKRMLSRAACRLRTSLSRRSLLSRPRTSRKRPGSSRKGFSRVLMVSDPIHMKRSVTMARDWGWTRILRLRPRADTGVGGASLVFSCGRRAGTPAYVLRGDGPFRMTLLGIGLFLASACDSRRDGTWSGNASIPRLRFCWWPIRWGFCAWRLSSIVYRRCARGLSRERLAVADR